MSIVDIQHKARAVDIGRSEIDLRLEAKLHAGHSRNAIESPDRSPSVHVVVVSVRIVVVVVVVS